MVSRGLREHHSTIVWRGLIVSGPNYADIRELVGQLMSIFPVSMEDIHFTLNLATLETTGASCQVLGILPNENITMCAFVFHFKLKVL